MSKVLGLGNTGHLIEFAKEKYEAYLYIEGAGSIIICNPDKGNSLKPHIYRRYGAF